MENKIDFDKEIEKAAKEYTDNSPLGKYKNDSGIFKLSYLGQIHDFIVGAKSEATKQYWQENMYSEEEVKKLCNKAWKEAFQYGVNGNYSHSKLADCNTFNTWFTQNKNK
jgi:hypothetical protein